MALDANSNTTPGQMAISPVWRTPGQEDDVSVPVPPLGIPRLEPQPPDHTAPTMPGEPHDLRITAKVVGAAEQAAEKRVEDSKCCDGEHSAAGSSTNEGCIKETSKKDIGEARTNNVRSSTSSSGRNSQRLSCVRSSAMGCSNVTDINEARRSSARVELLLTTEFLDDEDDTDKTQFQKFQKRMKYSVAVMQKYSVPLVLGVTTALVWSNVHEKSYHNVVDGALITRFKIDGHPVTLHFLVNDIFMCFFFGLAIKEVTEALLPGGSLSPISRAINPLLATLGGVLGPIAVYAAMVSVLYTADTFNSPVCYRDGYVPSAGGHRRLASAGAAAELPNQDCSFAVILKGWGVPTATDISLAWMFALLIFGVGHPAINFLLLLAILDDALGMVIIAVFYPDPAAPVAPLWLLLVLAAMVLASGLRKMRAPYWSMYVCTCGPVAWIGLLKAHVHPALTLVFVVPFMPACHAIAAHENERDLGAVDWGNPHDSKDASSHKTKGDAHDGEAPLSKEDSVGSKHSARPCLKKSPSMMDKVLSWVGNEEAAPLHVFEHTLKMPVDFGMFFFGLANAGVKLGSVGPLTASVLVGLLLGKTLGITGMSMLAVCLGFPLPEGLDKVDLLALSILGGIGLTVALFVSNEAFIEPDLQGQSKMGALLSVVAGPMAWVLHRSCKRRSSSVSTVAPDQPS